MRMQFEAKSSDMPEPMPKQQRKKTAGVQKKVAANKKAGALVIRDAPLGRDDMIPVMRDIDNLEVSFGSVWESMDFNDSVLGKRQMEGLLGRHLIAHDGNAMVPFEDVPEGGIQKKGKVAAQTLEDDASSKEREEDLEATSHGAAGKLTGSSVAPRQSQ
jgi:hypothetical protein